ncbi:MAG: hypothetical protein EOO56_20075 [Hymenobacter sp.]|nr:MAG: hypothetical protein EOO56_20075 [Hymenobacter sp.]
MLWGLRQRLLVQLFIIYLRYLIGGAFVFASLIKIKGHRFTSEDGSGAPVHSAVHFFETLYQSGIYWQFIGVGQLVAGLLLMSQRQSRLGAVLFLPIIANVFVITISYPFGFTPVITGLMLLGNLLLIWWEWPALRVVVHQPALPVENSPLSRDRVWEATGLFLFLFTFVYRVLYDEYHLLLWFGSCLLLGLAGLVAGLLRQRGRSNALAVGIS